MKPLARTIISYVITAIIVGICLNFYSSHFGRNFGFYVFLIFLIVLAWALIDKIVFFLLFPMDVKIISISKTSLGYYEVIYTYGKEKWYENVFHISIGNTASINQTELESILIYLTNSRFKPLFKRLSDKSRGLATNALYNEQTLSLTHKGLEMTFYF
nr:hypothetical protein [Pseudopedobacter sp.]